MGNREFLQCAVKASVPVGLKGGGGLCTAMLSGSGSGGAPPDINLHNMKTPPLPNLRADPIAAATWNTCAFAASGAGRHKSGQKRHVCKSNSWQGFGVPAGG